MLRNASLRDHRQDGSTSLCCFIGLATHWRGRFVLTLRRFGGAFKGAYLAVVGCAAYYGLTC